MKSGFTSGDFHRAVVRALPILMFATALLCIACGSSGSRSVTGLTVGTPPPGASNLTITADEVLAAPVPEGVDPQLWDELLSELARCLRSRTPSTLQFFGGMEDRHFETQLFVDGIHWWGPVLWGDGNLDGVVSIADLTAIAVNLGQPRSTGKQHIDYNWDGKVNVADIAVLARNWGRQGDSYIVEWSTSLSGPFYTVAEIQYGRLTGIDYLKRAEYSTEFDGRGKRRVYVRVKKRHVEGLRVSYESLLSAASDPYRAPLQPVTDLAVADTAADTVTWSTCAVIPDGNRNGIAELYDIDPLKLFFNQQWTDTESPLYISYAALADYDRNGTVSVCDMTPLAVHWGCYITHFVISLSTVSATDGFHDVGSVDYFTGCAGFNEFGFRYYEFTIPSPPEPPYWVTVTPYADDMAGVECTPLLVAAP